MVRKTKRRAANAAKVSKAVKKYVDKKVKHDGELKQLNVAFAGGVFPGTLISTTVGTQYTLNQIVAVGGPGAQGVGGYQRIGNKMSIEYLEIRFHLQLLRGQVVGIPATVTAGHESVRCVIYVEKFPEGINTNTPEMFYDTGNGLAVVSPMISSNKHRFTILHDKVYTFNSVDNTYPASGVAKYIEYKHRFKRPLITTYYPDTTLLGIAGIETGAIKMLLFSTDLRSGGTANTSNVTCPIYQMGTVYSQCLYRDD